MIEFLKQLRESANLPYKYKTLNEWVILTEDIEAVRNRFPDISDDDFYVILSLDPTYKKDSNSVGTYTKWMLNLVKRGAKVSDGQIVQNGETFDVKSLLSEFEQKRGSLTNKDIGQFKSLKEMQTALAQIDAPQLSQRQKERKLRKAYDDAELLISTDYWDVYTPTSFAGSCTLGKGTNWCTAYSENDSQYKNYTKQGPLYVLINKSDSTKKFQFHFPTSQYMNAENHSISEDEFDSIFNGDDRLCDFFLKLAYPDDYDKIREGGLELNITSSMYVDVISESRKNRYTRNRGDEVSIDFIQAYLEDEESGESYRLHELCDDYLISYFSMFPVKEYISQYADEDVIQKIKDRCGIEDISDFDYNDSDDDVQTALSDAVFDAQLEPMYTEITNIIKSSILSAWGDTSELTPVDGSIFNIVDNKKFRSFGMLKGFILNDEEDYNITNNAIYNRALTLFSEHFTCNHPYYGYNDFDGDVFNEVLNEYL